MERLQTRLRQGRRLEDRTGQRVVDPPGRQHGHRRRRQANGGDGGDANTGNTQLYNGNAGALSLGWGSKAEAEGGDTTAWSGDAQGGNGGDASARGGDAYAWNYAQVGQSNSADDPSGSRTEQDNESWIDQGDNTATGGNAEATGGDGGYANTGNTQSYNGNAGALALGSGNGEAEGGDTTAHSGNADGGIGGDASAEGGNANASNDAQVWQQNSSSGSGKPASWSGCKRGCDKGDGSRTEQDNESSIHQGDNTATGGDATANGGDGGDANTGNTQEHNSNAWAGLVPRKEVLI